MKIRALYSILKTIVRKVVKEKAHNEESYEDFVRISHKIQTKFRFKLSQKNGHKFKDEMIDGCHCIVGHKVGYHTKRALLYFVGDGERRY